MIRNRLDCFFAAGEIEEFKIQDSIIQRRQSRNSAISPVYREKPSRVPIMAALSMLES